LVPFPEIIDPPVEMFQEYPVIPDSVEYIFPVELTLGVAGPATVGTGNGFTVTPKIVGDEAVH
jgi:hypothetical protein